ncbi:hypothetical protein SKAU_G00265050 [Synaphobranchus kaupii]|uniref:THD domain-containing protein n=1 Tax=Synaphobranchus kaupii TaxID=118154 RepID=A0A9Q1EZ87_SYNKA|nr:hypothetical protein SKAU_G00265050 [Synaphobranchus kaupii]
MRNQTRSHMRFLSAVFVVQTVVTIALFIYLFQRIASNEDLTTFHNDLIVLKRLKECGGNSLDSGSPLDCNKDLEVTFSKMNPRTPLAQTVMCTRSSGAEDLLLKAFCSLRSGQACTSYQGRIVKLEEGQQLYVNVTDLSLVNFDVTATTFGLFLLQRNP